MKPSEFDPFEATLAGAAEVYGKTLSAQVVAIYWAALRRYELEAVRDAIGRHLVSPDQGQFMPKPADIVRMIEGGSADAAKSAWAEVEWAVRTVGPYPDVTFDDPVTMRVLADMGGWIDLGRRAEKEWPFVARDFEARYRAYRSQGTVPEHPATLTGMTNAERRLSGYQPAPPRLIGDAAKAGAVLAAGTSRPLIGVTTAGDAAMRLLGAA